MMPRINRPRSRLVRFHVALLVGLTLAVIGVACWCLDLNPMAHHSATLAGPVDDHDYHEEFCVNACIDSRSVAYTAQPVAFHPTAGFMLSIGRAVAQAPYHVSARPHSAPLFLLHQSLLI